MSIARVTSKGQITIPIEIRKALGIQQGDRLLFEIAPEEVLRLQVVKQRPLSELFRSLPATRPFPGKEALREEVGRALGTVKKGKNA
jgi:AbrB family looped-hinge helix DNA binding protein